MNRSKQIGNEKSRCINLSKRSLRIYLFISTGSDIYFFFFVPSFSSDSGRNLFVHFMSSLYKRPSQLVYGCLDISFEKLDCMSTPGGKGEECGHDSQLESPGLFSRRHTNMWWEVNCCSSSNDNEEILTSV